MPSRGELLALLKGHDPHDVRSVWCNRSRQCGWSVWIELPGDALSLKCESEAEARALVEELIDRAHDVGA